MSEEDAAPGWDAIDAPFERLYPGQKAEHWGTLLPTRVVFGGPEVLDGVSAYRASEPRPHWHWVTYGLTELYTKDSDDPEWSGWGYELTMRVPGAAGAGDAAPEWPIHLLQQLANWAHRSTTVLHAGEFVDTRGPITGEPGCTLTGLGLVEDPALPPIETPHGRVEFVEVIGLHPDELAQWREHGSEAVLAAAGRAFSGDFNELTRGSFV